MSALVALRRREHGPVEIRERLEDDVSTLESLARVVHETDGYPIYLPTGLREFLVGNAAHEAWVAEEGGQLLGHVALHHRSWDGVMEFACDSTGLANDDLAVVARLMVSPAARHRGIGRLLLATATESARSLGLCPILDVAVTYEAAVGLYEDAGWQRLGSVGFPMPDGTTIDEYVYLAPTAPIRTGGGTATGPPHNIHPL